MCVHGDHSPENIISSQLTSSMYSESLLFYAQARCVITDNTVWLPSLQRPRLCILYEQPCLYYLLIGRRREWSRAHGFEVCDMQLGLIKILDDSGRLPAYLFLRRLGGAEKMGGIRRLGDVLPWLCFRTVGGEMIVPDSKLGSGFIPAGTMTRGSGRQMMIKSEDQRSLRY